MILSSWMLTTVSQLVIEELCPLGKVIGDKKAVGDRSDFDRYTGSKIRAVQNARKVIQEGA
jgi:hypothetical protein